jgi:DNA replication protein DnaC
METSQLQSILRRLGLSGMAGTLPTRLRDAARLTHAEFLTLALSDEAHVRRQRQLARRIRAAGLYEPKGLAEFEWDRAPSLPRQTIEELAAGQFIREGRHALFLGPTQGKTHLANAIALEAIKQGHTVLYRCVDDLADAVCAAQSVQQRELVIGRFVQPDLLVIEADHWWSYPYASDCLLEVIAQRGAAKSILFISRRALRDWDAFFQDLPDAGLVLGRFTSRSTVIIFDCPRVRRANDLLWRAEPPGPSQAPLPLLSPPGSQPSSAI